ncbi:MAG: HAD-IC family P-type ATPase [Thermoflexales bacterium]|nr:HAD-IC family P-type ATPase [Thermoflexales bacterium]
MTIAPVVSPLTGLTEADAQQRAASGQRNTFTVKSARSVWDILRENVFTVFNVVLFITLAALYAISLSAPSAVRRSVLGDALFSGGTVAVNILVGVFQELRAKRALDRLAALAVRKATVIREGVSRTLDADQIVQDDLVVLAPGDRVPVDGPVVQGTALELDESLLTGESDLAPKALGDDLRSGTFVAAGNGVMIAEKVGKNSYANALTLTARGSRETRTPLQIRVNAVIEVLVVVMAVIAALQLISGQNRHEPLIDTLRHVTVIITSFVPAGLILAITVSLSVGAVRMARFDTLVQRINAVESMGNVTTVCVDKTGTLTQNHLRLVDVIPLGRHSVEDARQALAQYAAGVAYRNSTAQAISEGVGAPVNAARACHEVAFSSARKYGALAFESAPAGCHVLALGAPDVLLDRSSDAHRDALDRVAALTAEGLRVVVAVRDEGDDPTLVLEHRRALEPLALAVIRDEIRPDIVATMKAFAQAGVRVIVISGDNAGTVRAIAGQAGLTSDRVITERELGDVDPAHFDTAVREHALFARITPETKRRIIETLTRHGEYVAMVGDGVNDVPALKASRLAIAMNDGAPIARDVSELILLKNTMSALPRALAEGQDIIQKVMASAKLYLTKNALTILAILFAEFVSLPFPADPRQISWITTVTVGIPCLALAFGWLIPNYTRGFSRGVLGYSIGVGAVGAVVCAAAYIISAQMGDPLRASRTVFALTNLHYALHVMLDTMGVNFFSFGSIRKHPRAVLAGTLLLIVGLGFPFVIPFSGRAILGLPLPEAFDRLNLFNIELLTPWQWVLVVGLPLLGALAMRALLYGAYARRIFRALQHD